MWGSGYWGVGQRPRSLTGHWMCYVGFWVLGCRAAPPQSHRSLDVLCGVLGTGV
ncbi:hypothetical protein FKM82_017300 [Ascaphus truei]